MLQNFFRFFCVSKFVYNNEFCTFIEVMIFFLGNAFMLIWFWNGDVLHHFCGRVLKALPFLHFVFYITCIPLNIWHSRWIINLMKNLICFLGLLTLESWCCTWLQHRALLFPKHEEHFPGFKVFLFIFYTMLLATLLLPINSLRFSLRLKAVTGSFWIFFFRDWLTDSMFQLFRITLLMFGKNWLYAIVKGMSVLIGVPFLLLFIRSFLSNFSTVLMWLSNSAELYLCSRNRCLSSLQWCSESFNVIQIRLILSVWLYGILSLRISDVLNLHEGSSIGQFVFYIFWCKVYCSWYTPLSPKSLLFLIYTSVSKKFTVLDIHLCLQKGNIDFCNFVLKFNWVVSCV